MGNRILIQTVANNLLKYREEKNMTQEVLAEKAGISSSFLGNLERGNKGMSIFVLHNLASALDVSVNCLLHEPSKNSRVDNIIALLQNQPEDRIRSIEQIVRVCLNEFDRE